LHSSLWRREWRLSPHHRLPLHSRLTTHHWLPLHNRLTTHHPRLLHHHRLPESRLRLLRVAIGWIWGRNITIYHPISIDINRNNVLLTLNHLWRSLHHHWLRLAHHHWLLLHRWLLDHLLLDGSCGDHLLLVDLIFLRSLVHFNIIVLVP